MSTPLTSLTVTVAINNNLQQFTITIEDIIVVDTSFERGMDTAVQKLVDQHDRMQGMDNSQLSTEGQDFRDQKLNFGTP